MPTVDALTRRTQSYIQRTPSLSERLGSSSVTAPENQNDLLSKQAREQQDFSPFASVGQSSTAELKPVSREGSLQSQAFAEGSLAAPYTSQLSQITQIGASARMFAEQAAAKREAERAAAKAAKEAADRAREAAAAAARNTITSSDVYKGSGNDLGSRIVSAALKQLGVPYVWGGGGARGASKGIAAGAVNPYQATHTVGFDCSGLVQYAYARAGLKIPRVSYGQLHYGRRASLKSLRPGDLVGFGNGHHIGIYIGGGKFIESPHTGANVRISSLKGRSDAWGVKIIK